MQIAKKMIKHNFAYR